MLEISRLRFDALAGYSRTPHVLLLSDERGWYSAADERVLGVILQDRSDKDYVCIILGRDAVGRYRAVKTSQMIERLRAAQAEMKLLLIQWAAKDPVEFEQGDEPREPMEFFHPYHPIERLHPGFAKLVAMEEYSPAKGIMQAMMYHFKAPDGNFVEQFQSAGFNPRFWELYLFALLAEGTYAINREYPAPDFLCTGVAGQFFIEAMTVNPTMRDGQVSEPPIPEDDEEYARWIFNYLPTKFAGPLTAKLARKYWEEPHIGGKPVVFAIADFHRPFAMTMSQTSLLMYLYGRKFDSYHDRAGNLGLTSTEIKEHVWGTKVVPSGFFNLPDARHVSAVLSSREATLSKFNRIGMKAGFGSPRVRMIRSGDYYVRGRNQSKSRTARVAVHGKKYRERWTDGLLIYHNPSAEIPLNPLVFPNALHHFLDDDALVPIEFDGISPWFGSRTKIFLTPR